MNQADIQDFVYRYLQTTGSEIIEKHPSFVTVKLSPEADRALTNRSYYWNFVERTGVEPETMTFTFIFDPAERAQWEQSSSPKQAKGQPKAGSAVQGQASQAAAPASAQAQGQANHPAAHAGTQAQPQSDSILNRYFGFVPTGYAARVPQDELTFGSRRLDAIFQSVKNLGRFVQLFEEPERSQGKFISTGYSSWLIVNYKVEYICDMKRDELHSLGINLITGEIMGNIYIYVQSKQLTPRLPANTYIVKHQLSIAQAVERLEQHLEQRLQQHDHSWAREANERWREEEARVNVYYKELLAGIEEDLKTQASAQYQSRLEETSWQHKPRIHVSAINSGIFHLIINDIVRA